MSDWPIWRTDIPAARAAGLGPHWMGVVSVLFALPILSVVVSVLASWVARYLFGAADLAQTLREVGAFFGMTPVGSWIGLLFAVPLAVLAGRRGFGGWLVAIVAGAVAGMIANATLGGSGKTSAVMTFASIGAVFGAAYWLTARLTVPAAFRSPDQAIRN